jgi:uncharacterized protein (DUF433 family)
MAKATIVRKPGIMGGQACIAGTRVTAMDVWNTFRSGVSIEQLRTYFSSRELTTVEVEESLRFAMNALFGKGESRHA